VLIVKIINFLNTLRMSVSLNDFSREELEFAINVMTDVIDDLNRKIQQLSDFEDSELKTRFMSETDKDFETALLWRVQLSNALDQVKNTEKIANT
jgi:hypothetical protein